MSNPPSFKERNVGLGEKAEHGSVQMGSARAFREGVNARADADARERERERRRERWTVEILIMYGV